ncbi:hypothetical protein PHSY_004592 [Pseudozyma hubeiensis SY62]|uniref:Uncharacterized protein n=1 Tax=Pseudozyma hubeiensis (strain SY62) TaxID=1305764 RepID=R9P6H0_PSEHS|nr:hypothetical protein PHSY_004592 [Pseudozyma hubeiensis SY62]GAC97008.1 hypothetical protein PHSY_004592 [Pseudozyma hubeiensis SY62]
MLDQMPSESLRGCKERKDEQLVRIRVARAIDRKGNDLVSGRWRQCVEQVSLANVKRRCEKETERIEERIGVERRQDAVANPQPTRKSRCGEIDSVEA